MTVGRPFAVTLVVAWLAATAPHAAALAGLPPELPLRGFDPDRQVIENALRSARG